MGAAPAASARLMDRDQRLHFYRHWTGFGLDEWALGESVHCFRFILGVSIPLGACLLVMLRCARPLTPVCVAAIGGLGVAAMAVLAMQFFHSFDMKSMDPGVHFIAVGTVISAASIMEHFARTRRVSRDRKRAS